METNNVHIVHGPDLGVSTAAALGRLVETSLSAPVAGLVAGPGLSLADNTIELASRTPIQDALSNLRVYFVSLGPESTLDMAMTVTLACPKEWVVFGSQDVVVLPVTHMGSGVLVRLAAASARVPADLLLAHACDVVSQNVHIEQRRQEIERQQQEAQVSLQRSIATLMEETGGYPLASAPAVTPPAPVLPPAPQVYDPAPAYAVVPPPPAQPSAAALAFAGRPPMGAADPAGQPLIPGRPDIQYSFRPQEERSDAYNDSTNGGIAAPTLEELARAR